MSDLSPNKPSFGDWGSLKHWFTLHWRFLILGISLPLLLFGILALKVGEHPNGLSWDLSILSAIHTTWQPEIEPLVIILTSLGIFPRIVLLVIPVILTLGYQKKWRSLLYLVLTILGSVIISISTKIFFHRMRPSLFESSYPLPGDFSFPSGHATLSMTFAITLVILTWKTKWRWLVISLGGLFTLVIAWTRLYLGVHFPSDILGGWFLAITWSVFSSLLFNIHRFNSIPNHQS
ncbi:Phosphoesterase PA-phosphatase related protein [Planktothrix sp. PCC 11201]|uniref:phosphatase PAP2 family protein n=1 Tax=Planktothrix sp. PCC 11201 TaxID=1729650 RepID=UPI0009229B27|nr:phosphatase PAP2 family protein [Planktothrix sp. PCC 11201]SKB11310.1 Phosphoesterase PA-phosphatase related protein [Planktothrix sp. PCC 11201]